MRPKKIRQIARVPREKCFRPQCIPLRKAEIIYLSLDEYEAIRLADFKGLDQRDAAKKMKISSPTFSRIISSAHSKIGDALVNIKAIRIIGGCCNIIHTNKLKKRKKVKE